MKAAVLRLPARLDRIDIVDMAYPGLPGPGEMRVRIYASSLNFHDLGVVTGRISSADGRILMSDGAGVVEAVGDGVTEFRAGDSVVSCFFPLWMHGGPTIADFSTTPGDGVDGYARECVVRPAQWFTHAPRGYSHGEAATLTTAGLTAWRALVVDGQLKSGESVLVLGTGGVSIFALQLARQMGAEVIVTSSSDKKLERALALGAHHVINYRRYPEWAAKVRQLTHGRGVDHVIEVGGPNTLEQSITACRIGGHIALIGSMTGTLQPSTTRMLMRRQQRLQGLVVGSRQQQIEMVRGIEVAEVRPVIDATFGLDDIEDAFRYQREGNHFGKICLAI